MKNQNELRRILRIRKWKESGASISEEDIAKVAKIVLALSEKQILEALVFEDGNKDLTAARLLATSPSPGP